MVIKYFKYEDHVYLNYKLNNTGLFYLFIFFCHTTGQFAPDVALKLGNISAVYNRFWV